MKIYWIQINVGLSTDIEILIIARFLSTSKLTGHEKINIYTYIYLYILQ